jgi:hypothetical protein
MSRTRSILILETFVRVPPKLVAGQRSGPWPFDPCGTPEGSFCLGSYRLVAA